ncbi:hypothetical protein [Rhizobium leguminosarum]|uniref:hypothetical protein n=1 Tax=Rhizobium leguminosarum TaxID=384 RepID=UPI0012DB0631
MGKDEGYSSRFQTVAHRQHGLVRNRNVDNRSITHQEASAQALHRTRNGERTDDDCLARDQCLSDVVREKAGVTDDGNRFAGGRTERFHGGCLQILFNGASDRTVRTPRRAYHSRGCLASFYRLSNLDRVTLVPLAMAKIAWRLDRYACEHAVEIENPKY